MSCNESQHFDTIQQIQYDKKMTDDFTLDPARTYKPKQPLNQQKASQKPEIEPIDLNDPAALRNLAKSALVEIVQTAPRNVSLVAAIRELLDRIDGKAPQSIALDVQDNRMDKMPIDRLLKLAALLDDPPVINQMPSQKLID